jgi:DNA-binding MarR family transcriptional regulator
MKVRAERELEILAAIEEGATLTQRALAERLGVALGLANLYLKRLAKKGYIKIAEFPRKPAARKRLRYLLTPKGLTEKTRLTYEHMAYALSLYRRARQTLRESLNLLPENGMKRIALYGTGEAAELAYLTLKELGLEPVGIFAREAGGHFLGLPVRAASEMEGGEFDRIVLATFERPGPHVVELARLGLPREKFLTLRRVASSAEGNGSRRRSQNE